jgi:polyphosphate:AMP phosphotransferase
MFEAVELGRTVGEDEYAELLPKLRTELLGLQRRFVASGKSVVVLLQGFDGAGRGEVLNLMHEWLDARYLVTEVLGKPTEEERERPAYWRFWMTLPPRGRVGIFFGGWYGEPLVQAARGEMSSRDFDAAMARARSFEGSQVDDGAVIVKFWLYIDKAEQRRRFEKLAKKKRAWPVTKQDWLHHKLYGEFRRVAERMIRLTSTADSPWTVVEATDRRHRNVEILSHLIARLKAALEQASAPAPVVQRSPLAVDGDGGVPALGAGARSVLARVDLSKTLEEDAYEQELEELQARVGRLGRRMAKRRRGAILVFEGWDAAGKGGAIRRVTHALDARNYQIIPIAAPTDEERAHHYLWRFWRHLPRRGRVTIYDRSWYGRVLVERVEGYASEHQWSHAYSEINDFEEQLVEAGVVVAKFWVHIDPDEQLRRFREREGTPWKQHKIGPEDWRNRDRWVDYERAVGEMVERTSTEYAPWTLVSGNDKRVARLEVLREVCRRLQEED